MSKKVTNKFTLKIAAATMLTIFSLFAFFMSTIAWFTAKKIANNQADTIALKNEQGKISCIEFYQVAENPNLADDELDIYGRDLGIRYHFSTTPVGKITANWETRQITPSGATNISLGTYSPLYGNKQPVMIRVTLIDDKILANEEYKITGETDQTTFVAAASAIAGYDEENDTNYNPATASLGHYKNPLSSVISWSSKAYTKTEFDNEFTDSDEYVFDKSTLAANEDSFVNLSNNTLTPSKEMYSGSCTTGSMKYITFVFYYNEDSLAYIYNAYLGQRVLEYETLLFYCDWKMML